MNILLFLPGLLVLLFQYRGLLGTFEGVSLITAVQVSPINPVILGLRRLDSATPSRSVLPLPFRPDPEQSIFQLSIQLLPRLPVRMDRQLAFRRRTDIPLKIMGIRPSRWTGTPATRDGKTVLTLSSCSCSSPSRGSAGHPCPAGHS